MNLIKWICYFAKAELFLLIKIKTQSFDNPQPALLVHTLKKLPWLKMIHSIITLTNMYILTKKCGHLWYDIDINAQSLYKDIRARILLIFLSFYPN